MFKSCLERLGDLWKNHQHSKNDSLKIQHQSAFLGCGGTSGSWGSWYFRTLNMSPQQQVLILLQLSGKNQQDFHLISPTAALLCWKPQFPPSWQWAACPEGSAAGLISVDIQIIIFAHYCLIDVPTDTVTKLQSWEKIPRIKGSCCLALMAAACNSQ